MPNNFTNNSYDSFEDEVPWVTSNNSSPSSYTIREDAVNGPRHYNNGDVECIDAMEAMLNEEEFIGYLRGNSFKYRWRYTYKDGEQDLKKARWYEDKLLKVYENNLDLKEIQSGNGQESGTDC